MSLSGAKPDGVVPTTRQLDLLQAIARLSAKHGFPPTVRELAAELEISVVRAAQLLDRLEVKGLVERRRMVARALWLTAAGRAALSRSTTAAGSGEE